MNKNNKNFEVFYRLHIFLFRLLWIHQHELYRACISNQYGNLMRCKSDPKANQFYFHALQINVSHFLKEI